MDEIRHAESTPVQLTRIEGVINNINYKIDDTINRVGRIEDRMERVNTDIHSLQLEAKARESTTDKIDKALKDSELERASASERRWSPIARFYASLVAAGVIVNAVWVTWSIIKT